VDAETGVFMLLYLDLRTNSPAGQGVSQAWTSY
jgi:hypothetical protein